MFIKDVLPTTHSPLFIMSDAPEQQQPKERFAPKQAVELAPPKKDEISREQLSKSDGELPTDLFFSGSYGILQAPMKVIPLWWL